MVMQIKIAYVAFFFPHVPFFFFAVAQVMWLASVNLDEVGHVCGQPHDHVCRV